MKSAEKSGVMRLVVSHYYHLQPRRMTNLGLGGIFKWEFHFFRHHLIEKYFPESVLFLQIKPMREDIMRYVEMMLDDDPNPKARNTGLGEIMNQVSETISDVYVKY